VTFVVAGVLCLTVVSATRSPSERQRRLGGRRERSRRGATSVTSITQEGVEVTFVPVATSVVSMSHTVLETTFVVARALCTHS
jgi:hypothetical protein